MKRSRFSEEQIITILKEHPAAFSLLRATTTGRDLNGWEAKQKARERLACVSPPED